MKWIAGPFATAVAAANNATPVVRSTAANLRISFLPLVTALCSHTGGDKPLAQEPPLSARLYQAQPHRQTELVVAALDEEHRPAAGLRGQARP